MSDPSDPNFWKTAADWAWSILLVPIGMAWKKIASSPSRKDFDQHVEEDKKIHQEFREDMKEMFRAAEADRKFTRDYFDRISERSHELHIEVLKRIADTK